MLLVQTTKQPLSNFEPKNIESINSNFEGWGLTLVGYKKISVMFLLVNNKLQIMQKRPFKWPLPLFPRWKFPIYGVNHKNIMTFRYFDIFTVVQSVIIWSQITLKRF